MIVLDTNALSETLKPLPSSAVLRWLASQEPTSIFVTVITQAEMLYGVEVLASGKRKQGLLTLTEKLFGQEGFQGRILPFDQQSAGEYASILASRKAAGRPMSQSDAMHRRHCPFPRGCGCNAQYQRLRRLRDPVDQPMDSLIRMYHGSYQKEHT